MEPVVQDAGACAGAFFLEAEGAVARFLDGIVVVLGPHAIVVVLIPPWHEFHLQLSQPMPHCRARPIRIAERSERAPPEGLDAGDGEIVDGKVSEERDGSALERESEREEGLKRILIRGGEAKVL